MDPKTQKLMIIIVVAAVAIVAVVALVLMQPTQPQLPSGGGGDGDTGGDVSTEYNALIERCKQEANAGDDWKYDMGVINCVGNSPTAAAYMAWCDASGGVMEPAPSTSNPPRAALLYCASGAKDAGKVCTSDSDCEGWCIPTLTPEQEESLGLGDLTGMTGKCSKSLHDGTGGSSSCPPRIENGVVRSMVCTT